MFQSHHISWASDMIAAGITVSSWDGDVSWTTDFGIKTLPKGDPMVILPDPLI